MTALPAITEFTGSTVTESQFKSAVTNLRAFLAGILGTDGASSTALAALGAVLSGVSDKSSGYTVVADDRGKVIRCTGTFTLGITDAATLGSPFAFAVYNNGTGTITIDPASTQTIDGAPTKSLAAGKLAIVFGDGANFVTVGGFSMGPGSGLDADTLDGFHATQLVLADSGSGSVGAMGLLMKSLSGSQIIRGATYSGASLLHVQLDTSGGYQISTSATGTWRALSGGTATPSGYAVSLFQRIV